MSSVIHYTACFIPLCKKKKNWRPKIKHQNAAVFT